MIKWQWVCNFPMIYKCKWYKILGDHIIITEHSTCTSSTREQKNNSTCINAADPHCLLRPKRPITTLSSREIKKGYGLVVRYRESAHGIKVVMMERLAPLSPTKQMHMIASLRNQLQEKGNSFERWGGIQFVWRTQLNCPLMIQCVDPLIHSLNLRRAFFWQSSKWIWWPRKPFSFFLYNEHNPRQWID